MANATQDIDTTSYAPQEIFDYKTKGATTFYAGILVNSDASGFLVPGADTASHKCVGRSEEGKVSKTGDGNDILRVGNGVFEFATSGANAIVQADVGRLCYVLDNQTVVKAAGTTNSVIAGKVVKLLSATRVLVDTRVKAV